jgi:hypothetical protein
VCTNVIIGRYAWIWTVHEDGRIPTVQRARRDASLGLLDRLDSSPFSFYSSSLPLFVALPPIPLCVVAPVVRFGCNLHCMLLLQCALPLLLRIQCPLRRRSSGEEFSTIFSTSNQEVVVGFANACSQFQCIQDILFHQPSLQSFEVMYAIYLCSQSSIQHITISIEINWSFRNLFSQAPTLFLNGLNEPECLQFTMVKLNFLAITYVFAPSNPPSNRFPFLQNSIELIEIY